MKWDKFVLDDNSVPRFMDGGGQLQGYYQLTHDTPGIGSRRGESIGTLDGVPVYIAPLANDFPCECIAQHMLNEIAKARASCATVIGYALSPNDAKRWQAEMAEFCTVRMPFTPAEVEAAKAYGSARYQEAAADCDQLRMLKMELDYQEEQERYRLANAELLGWMTDADVNESCDADERLLDEDIEERKAALRRAATPVLPFETFGDWRERHGFYYVGEWMRALYVECGGTLRPEHVQL